MMVISIVCILVLCFERTGEKRKKRREKTEERGEKKDERREGMSQFGAVLGLGRGYLGHFEVLWGSPGASWGPRWASGGALMGLLWHLVLVLGLLGVLMVVSWDLLGASWVPLGGSWGVLRTSWEPFGSFLGLPWEPFVVICGI